MKMRMLFMMIGMLTGWSLMAQNISVEQYIDKYKQISINEMKKSGIPASITLAQGILESRYGNSRLAVKANNHFGIKCHTGWTGKKIYHDDDKRNECFRVYKNAHESYRDHADFLQSRSRYAFLFRFSSTDYKKWAHGLKKAGYATNPKYGYILVDLIEKHELYLYDRPNADVFASRDHSKRHDKEEVRFDKDYKPAANTVDKTNNLKEIDRHTAETFSFNRIKTVRVGPHDNIQLLADRHYVPVGRLLKYNDLNVGDQLEVGHLFYLQPKRSKARQRNHIVQRGESLWEISQMHGVKLDKLYARNLLRIGEEPAAGQYISLNKKVDKKPKLKTDQQRRIEEQEREKKEQQQQSKKEELEKIFSAAEKGLADEEKKAAEELKSKETILKEKSSDLEPVAVPRTEPKEDIEESKPKVKEEEQIEIDASPKEKLGHVVKKGDTLWSISKKYNVSVTDIKKWNNLTSNAISIDQVLIIQP